MAIINVNNLCKSYQIPVKQGFIKGAFFPKHKGLAAVDGISFRVNEGEAVAFLGPNGAGKTTTLKMLTGIMYPTSGEVQVLGYTPIKREYSFLRQIAMVMGNKNSLSWDLSSQHGFQIFQTIYELEPHKMHKTINELADLLDVADVLDRPVRKLSLGQRLKVELIGAILHDPKILFLDEPTLGLDILAKRNIREFLKRINKSKGKTLILTSHDMADVEKVAERVIIINLGKIVFDGLITEMLKKYQSKKYLTLILEEKVEETKIKSFGKIIDQKPLSYTLEIEAKNQSAIIAQITNSLPVDDIDIVHVPLEEIIGDLFKK